MDVATIPRADRVIAISRDSYAELAGRYPVSRDALVHVPHGVNADRFHPDHDSHDATTGDRFTLLHVGRLVSRKHVDLGLRALAALDRPDIELLVAGDGTHRSRLEELAERLGVADRTEFLGFVPEADLPSLYAGSDAFLFLSRYEGFGLTFLESMASATPVIGTAVGGFPDIVTSGQDGVVVDRDPDDVAAAIARLVDAPDRLARMRASARATAEARTWETVAADTERVYEDVVE